MLRKGIGGVSGMFIFLVLIIFVYFVASHAFGTSEIVVRNLRENEILKGINDLEALVKIVYDSTPFLLVKSTFDTANLYENKVPVCYDEPVRINLIKWNDVKNVLKNEFGNTYATYLTNLENLVMSNQGKITNLEKVEFEPGTISFFSVSNEKMEVEMDGFKGAGLIKRRISIGKMGDISYKVERNMKVSGKLGTLFRELHSEIYWRLNTVRSRLIRILEEVANEAKSDPENYDYEGEISSRLEDYAKELTKNYALAHTEKIGFEFYDIEVEHEVSTRRVTTCSGYTEGCGERGPDECEKDECCVWEEWGGSIYPMPSESENLIFPNVLSFRIAEEGICRSRPCTLSICDCPGCTETTTTTTKVKLALKTKLKAYEKIFPPYGIDEGKEEHIYFGTTFIVSTDPEYRPFDCPYCGNGVCEAGENCGNCPQDCSCPQGYICKAGKCQPLSNWVCKLEDTNNDGVVDDSYLYNQNTGEKIDCVEPDEWCAPISLCEAESLSCNKVKGDFCCCISLT